MVFRSAIGKPLRATTTSVTKRFGGGHAAAPAYNPPTHTLTSKNDQLHDSIQHEEDGVSLRVPYQNFKVKYVPEMVQMEGKANRTVQKTKLDNGVTVVSTDSFMKGNSVVSLFIDAGSRYESFANAGVSHFVQRFLFSATSTRSSLRLLTEMQKFGALEVSGQNGREEIVYRTESLREAVPKLWELITDSVLNGRLHAYDMAPKRDAVKRDLVYLSDSPQIALNEALHYAAFGGKTLGRSQFCPPYNVDDISVDTIAEYMNTLFTGDRMTLVATNVAHEDAVALAQGLLAGVAKGQGGIKKESAQYVGGDFALGEKRGTYDGASTHTAIAFEGASTSSPLFYATQVLGNLLDQTSAPQNLANGLREQQSFSLGYSDSGLFGVLLKARSSNAVAPAVQNITQRLKALASSNAASKNLDVAKNRVLLDFASNLETSAGLNEFVAKNNNSENVYEQHVNAIKSVTAEQVRQVAEAVVKSKPTVASYGVLEGVPTSHNVRF